MTSPIEPPQGVAIRASVMEGAGRGVFATKGIAAGTLIEQCPVIALKDPNDRARLRKTPLVNYYFLWGEGRKRVALCLGWGSIYNHSFTPNATYEKVMADDRMDFYTLRDIKEGEEITVNYNGAPDDLTPLLIPGIPAEAGGPPASSTPRLVSGVLRRLRLLKTWLMGASSCLVVFSNIPVIG